MGDKVEISLRDGTLVRHKNKGYEGKIEGTTAIKTCFTRGGNLLDTPISKEPFQYRVVVSGMSLRYIAPVDDLEILDEAVEIRCVRCSKPFYTKPGVAAKACGRCACGGWICPVCLGCQPENSDNQKAKECAHQRKRFAKKLANEKK
jgi:hypothetical protein